MDKSTKIYGIDISKDVFDVTDQNQNHHQFKNNYKGFKKPLKVLDPNSHCVMEATGYYHYKLAYFLQENEVLVSVENPLSVKRFIQMKLSKIKTDKSDSKMIMRYAENTELRLWQGDSKTHQECLQMTRILSIYSKHSTALKNKIHGEEVLGTPSKLVVRSLKKTLKNLKKEMDMIEDKLLELVKKDHQELLTLVESIPGIGRKTSVMLVVLTDGFKRFNSAAELCSYAGLTPVIRTSGSSVKGKSRISKIGNQKLRNLLFMCSFNASKYNTACKALYDRIVAKGKSKKLALIAVCNKLLKQAFAIAKSKVPYDKNYRSTLQIN
jgi:Transposase and inactivated derivatives